MSIIPIKDLGRRAIEDYNEREKEHWDNLEKWGETPDWKAEYARAADLHCKTLDELREAAVEIDRLKQQIRYQDQRDGRIGTHSPHCYSFGPHHYECALRKIEDLESKR